MHIRGLEKSGGIIVVIERTCESRGKVRSSMICNRGRLLSGSRSNTTAAPRCRAVIAKSSEQLQLRSNSSCKAKALARRCSQLVFVKVRSDGK